MDGFTWNQKFTQMWFEDWFGVAQGALSVGFPLYVEQRPQYFMLNQRSSPKHPLRAVFGQIALDKSPADISLPDIGPALKLIFGQKPTHVCVSDQIMESWYW